MARYSRRSYRGSRSRTRRSSRPAYRASFRGRSSRRGRSSSGGRTIRLVIDTVGAAQQHGAALLASRGLQPAAGPRKRQF